MLTHKKCYVKIKYKLWPFGRAFIGACLPDESKALPNVYTEEPRHRQAKNSKARTISTQNPKPPT